MRKSATFTASDGRDSGKLYIITEASASQAERWAMRALFSIGKAGIDVPPRIAEQGIAGLLSIALMNLAKMAWEDAEPLLEEMMLCVKVEPSPGVKRDLVETDIEEIATRLKLRKAVWQLHTDFFTDESPSTSASPQPSEQKPVLNIKTPRKQSQR